MCVYLFHNHIFNLCKYVSEIGVRMSEIMTNTGLVLFIATDDAVFTRSCGNEIMESAHFWPSHMINFYIRGLLYVL